MGTNTDWSANFAASGVDALSAYDEILVPRLFDPWGEVLLDQVGLSAGQAVLDVACGPGTMARLAAGRLGPSGQVTGCDLSPGMLELAAAKKPVEGAAPITYQECPADDLPLPDDAFDVVLCQQGLQFFPDKAGALAEMRRVLKPGGRAGVAVWCAIEECPFWHALAGALGEVLGKETEMGFRSGPWGLPEADELQRLFDAAGFTDVDVRRHASAGRVRGRGGAARRHAVSGLGGPPGHGARRQGPSRPAGRRRSRPRPLGPRRGAALRGGQSHRRGHPLKRPVPAAGEPSHGGWVWGLLAGAIAVWELQAFLQQPRRAHPTLSSLSNDLLQSPSSRVVAAVLWLAARHMAGPTMSRTVTLWGYAVLTVAAVAYQAAGLLRRQTATFGQAVRRLKAIPASRPVLLAGWLWLGWHIFVRGTYD